MQDDNSVEVFFPKLPKPILCDIEDVPKLMDITNSIDHKNKKGDNLRISYFQEKVPISHLVLFGKRKRGILVDHLNHDIYDNTKKNLDICSDSENAHNKPKTTRKTQSKFLGVADHGTEKYRAYISKEGKRIHIGTFIDEIDAAKARDKVAFKLYGKHAALNFPEDFKAQTDTAAPSINVTTGDEHQKATNIQGHE